MVPARKFKMPSPWLHIIAGGSLAECDIRPFDGETAAREDHLVRIHVAALLFVTAMGVPARYVSGYIHLPKWSDKGTTASHAWAEAWVAGRGWIGFDATHPVRTTPHHVRLAVGRDYTDAAPTRGVYVGSAGSTMSVSVKTRALS